MRHAPIPWISLRHELKSLGNMLQVIHMCKYVNRYVNTYMGSIQVSTPRLSYDYMLSTSFLDTTHTHTHVYTYIFIQNGRSWGCKLYEKIRSKHYKLRYLYIHIYTHHTPKNTPQPHVSRWCSAPGNCQAWFTFTQILTVLDLSDQLLNQKLSWIVLIWFLCSSKLMWYG